MIQVVSTTKYSNGNAYSNQIIAFHIFKTLKFGIIKQWIARIDRKIASLMSIGRQALGDEHWPTSNEKDELTRTPRFDELTRTPRFNDNNN